MKHFFNILFVSALAHLSVQGQIDASKQQFVLSGTIVGQDTGFVHLWYTNNFGNRTHDSVYLKEGRFQFKGNITEPTKAVFYVSSGARINEANVTEFFMEPVSMQARFSKGDFKGGKLIGSSTQGNYLLYQQRLDSLQRQWKKIFDELNEARSKNDTSKVDAIGVQISVYNEKVSELNKGFIREFPQSYVSASILSALFQRMPLDSAGYYYSLLSPLVQESRDGKEVAEFIQKGESLVIGKKAPGFTTSDYKGRQVALNDFKGKYVLLDFWASWCLPCRKEHPFLIKAYEEYRSKGFDIISISLDEEKQRNAWLKAIEEDRLSWTQVCDPKALEGNLSKQYNLATKGIPANFLLNPEGRIIAVDLRGKDLQKVLGQHLED